MQLTRFLATFDSQPDLLAIELRPGDCVWLMYDGIRGTETVGSSDMKVTAEDTLAAVREFYPDPDHIEWKHFYSGGKRLIRDPRFPVVIRILYDSTGFNLLFIRSAHNTA